ncbi:ABC transporter substrate-binding protein [Lysobacter sp. A6]|uniref:ABC transporter substrate-binding protein n=1 Tax=Noviluteimonas lactosilytica TaxID=2888523 RepID=A0ABS8JHN6_9GAMM|nr:ABC transporter substrate-binding protein [Lysobacter lactosilyticus]MCC8363121.1 ABC transporter substrate-binding protein [Lysobacter lactosilyticus]
MLQQALVAGGVVVALTLAASPIVRAQNAAPAAPAANAAAAMQGSPSQLVLANSTRIVATLEKRRDEFKTNPAALNKFIATEFDRMFDREYAARLVLGRHGRGAAEADVKVFADALSDSLMSRYGSALLSFDTGLKVRVKSETPLRGGAIVKVSSEFIRAGGQATPVDYLMRKTGAQWQVFDVMVEGVSFVQTFRTQFDAPLSNKSIKQVAADLRAGKLQAQAQ